jgi:hypothetical protein
LVPQAVLSGSQFNLQAAVPRISSIMRRFGVVAARQMITTLPVMTVGIHFLAAG